MQGPKSGNRLLRRLTSAITCVIIINIILSRIIVIPALEENSFFGFLSVAGITVIAGCAIFIITARLITTPFITLTEQLKAGGEPVPAPKTGLTGIDSPLYSVYELHTQFERAKNALKHEYENCLYALMSTADAYVEYDVAGDLFIIRFFIYTDNNRSIHEIKKHGFIDAVNTGDLFHMDDIPQVTAFFHGNGGELLEARVSAAYFPHLEQTKDDNGYFSFDLKGTFIYDEHNVLIRIIGAAHNNTETKLSETTDKEASVRDITTGFYNRDYGKQLVISAVDSLKASETPFSLIIACINGYHAYEAHYGRYFTAFVIMRLGRALQNVIDDNIAVRLNSYEFLFLFSGGNKDEDTQIITRILKTFDEMYMGENKDIRLSMSIGIAQSSQSTEYNRLFSGAYSAAVYAEKVKERVSYAGGLLFNHSAGIAKFKINPVNIMAEITKENISAFAFDLFEHTEDTQSAVKILLMTIGEMFDFKQVVVCSYDSDFSVNRVSYQWSAPNTEPHSLNIEKIPGEDIASFERLFDGSGALLYDSSSIRDFPQGHRNLLCVTNNEDFSAVCCAVYESGVQSGRVIYKTNSANIIITPEEIGALNEISKIISAHICIQKSNTASRAKSEFLSRMSHEIRTPMNAIVGMARIAKKVTADKERLNDCLDKIDKSAMQLLTLVNNVLEMAQIESGDLLITEEPFSLDALIRDIDFTARESFQQNGQTFISSIDASNKTVIGDEARIKQVLLYLLDNAAKFTNGGGTITLCITEENAEDGFGYYRFSVTDTGIGLSQDEIRVIFDSFGQTTYSGQKSGAGLGLAISNNIIAAMGAQIEVFSEPNNGSRFSFALRLQIAREYYGKEGTSITPGDDTGSLSGKRVLLVDDNEINIEVARFILEDYGFFVDTAKNGKEAVDAFFGNNPFYYDAVLMDIQMPVMDGLTATREIRKNAERKDAQSVPIIAMTADVADSELNRFIETGMNGHIAKPLNNDTLFETLENLLL